MPNPLDWVRYRSVAFLTGRGLTFGASGILPPQARDIGKYAVDIDIVKHAGVPVCDSNFDLFAGGTADFVFVGQRLEEMPEPTGVLKTLISKLKVGGHLVLHLPLREFDPAFKGTVFSESSIYSLVSKSGAWLQKDVYLRDGQFLGIFKRSPGVKGITLRKSSTRPRACIARYGALGDMVMLTPLIRKLHEDGYDVTLNVTPYASPLLRYNPYVANIVHQERDAIPNSDLGAYWAEWATSYDRYINLSESIEGKLLMVEGRKEFYTSKTWRNSQCNTNYYDNTLACGGYPEEKGHNGELFFSNSEERVMAQFYKPLRGRFVILWALNGSSHHKVYPLMEPVMGDWLARHPDATLVTLGDARGKVLEFQHPQVICAAGEWQIRESLLATKYASCVVGPESAIVNGAACFDTPKITLLSHSSREALCKYWVNDFCLEPDTTLSPCYPCNQLHYTLESCPLTSIIGPAGVEVARGPSCAMGAISGERLAARLDEVYALGGKVK